MHIHKQCARDETEKELAYMFERVCVCLCVFVINRKQRELRRRGGRGEEKEILTEREREKVRLCVSTCVCVGMCFNLCVYVNTPTYSPARMFTESEGKIITHTDIHTVSFHDSRLTAGIWPVSITGHECSWAVSSSSCSTSSRGSVRISRKQPLLRGEKQLGVDCTEHGLLAM